MERLQSLRDGGKNILCACFQKLSYVCTLIMFGMIYFCIHAGQFYQCLVWLNGSKSAFYSTSVKRRVKSVLAYRKSTLQLYSLISGTSEFFFFFYILPLQQPLQNLLTQAYSSYIFILFSVLFRIFNVIQKKRFMLTMQLLSQPFPTLLLSLQCWPQITLLRRLITCVHQCPLRSRHQPIPQNILSLFQQ